MLTMECHNKSLVELINNRFLEVAMDMLLQMLITEDSSKLLAVLILQEGPRLQDM